MRSVLSIAVCFAVATGLGLAQAPRISCDNGTWDFGSEPQNQVLTHRFVVKNSGGGTLEIRKVNASCNCAAAAPAKNTLGPNEETEIEVTLRTLSFKGRLDKVITVLSNDTTQPMFQLNITGEVVPPYYVRPEQLHFGRFSKSDPSPELPFSIVMVAGTKVSVQEVSVSSDLIELVSHGDPEVREDGSTVRNYTARMKAGANVGLMRETVTILTDLPTLPRTVVPVNAEVTGEVHLSLQNLNFGSCKRGQVHEKELVVTKTGEANLTVEKVEVVATGKDGSQLTCFATEVETVEPGRKYRIKVRLSEDADAGYVKGSVNIFTNCPGERTVKAWFHAFISR